MPTRITFCSLVVCVASLLLLASVAQAQSNYPCGLTPTSPNVTTWHNDNCRTGWQQNEQTLTATGSTAVNQNNFGLLAQWNGVAGAPMGTVHAQPLAVGNLNGVQGCNGTCSLVLIADETDTIWAYNASSNSETPVWSLTLPALVGGGGPVDCQTNGQYFAPCEAGTILGNNVGITGTPVIDANANLMYVAAAIVSGGAINYYLFAIDILNGTVQGNPALIQGSVSPGQNPYPQTGKKCGSSYPATGDTLQFNPNAIQRSALLLLNGWVYVAFAPSDSEWENGWLFGYNFDGTNFSARRKCSLPRAMERAGAFGEAGRGLPATARIYTL